jgi:membrane associated rhomboid family serine protease
MMVFPMADNRCDYCGKYEMLPFNCKYCGGVFCSSHRLPEYHECTGLKAMKQGNWKSPAPNRKSPAAAPRGRKKRLPRVRLPGQGYYAYTIIGICILVFIIQAITQYFNIIPAEFFTALMLSAPPHSAGLVSTITYLITHFWTLITYMFLHAGIMHIFFNMLMLFFFGPLLERQIGSGRFLGLYLCSGIIAGLVQVLLFGGTVLGASAAVFGVMAHPCDAGPAHLPVLRAHEDHLCGHHLRGPGHRPDTVRRPGRPPRPPGRPGGRAGVRLPDQEEQGHRASLLASLACPKPRNVL